MKYAIIGIVLAINLGASAQAAGPGATDPQADTGSGVAQPASPAAADPGTTGGGAQQASPVAADQGATGGAAPPASPAAADPHAVGTSGDAQAAGPVVVETRGGSGGSEAQATSPRAIDLHTGATGSNAQVASPGPVALEAHAGSNGIDAQATSPGAIDLHASTTSSDADTPSPLAIELHAGSSGAGAQIEYIFNGYVTARISGDWLRFNTSFNTINFDTLDLSYSGGADWATGGAFIDIHPLKNGWFLSGGVFQGDRNATFAGTPVNDVIIEGVAFTPAEVGTVMGEAKLPSTSPFVGIGWDQAQHDRSGLTFRFVAGAAFGGAKVTLWDVGPYADTAPVQEWAAQEQAVAQKDVEPWNAYPVIQLGIGYRF
jgi:hypothetical protein